MKAYLVTLVSDSKVYINDEFVTLSRKINEIGYELQWRNNSHLSVNPILNDFKAYKTLNDLKEGIKGADATIIDSRLAYNDPLIYGISIGILASNNKGYGSYVIGMDNTNQSIIDDSLIYNSHSTFSIVKVDNESGITASVDGITFSAVTISEALGTGFNKLELDSSLSPDILRVSTLLGRAYADKVKVEYSPESSSSIIKVIINE